MIIFSIEKENDKKTSLIISLIRTVALCGHKNVLFIQVKLKLKNMSTVCSVALNIPQSMRILFIQQAFHSAIAVFAHKYSVNAIAYTDDIIWRFALYTKPLHSNRIQFQQNKKKQEHEKTANQYTGTPKLPLNTNRCYALFSSWMLTDVSWCFSFVSPLFTRKPYSICMCLSPLDTMCFLRLVVCGTASNNASIRAYLRYTVVLRQKQFYT